MKRSSSLTFAVIGAIACVLGAVLFELLFPLKGSSNAVETKSSSIALLIDTSGSMRDDNKITEVKRAASEYVAKQADAQGIVGLAVVRFSSDAQTVSPLSTDTAAHQRAISSFRADGATEMADGLEEAVRALSGTESGVARTILLFTDGQPGSNQESLEDAQARTRVVAERLRASGVRLLAVGTSDSDAGFLASLTGDSGLVFPTDAGSFAQAFGRADQKIKQLFASSSSSSGRAGRGFSDALILGAFVTLFLGTALLIAENTLALRGRWWRDLAWVTPMSAVLGVAGALLGQALFALLPDNAPSRAVAWLVVGAIAGSLLGLADRSRVKALRGMAGGAIGGYLGGFVFALLSGAFSGGILEIIGRLFGFAVLGFAIGLMLQLVQQALKTAWLTGITTGPYEGKQYILSKPIVTVGRSDGNDIGLYRETTLPLKLGAFQFVGNRWHYAGSPLEVNGALLGADAALSSGDTIRIGKTEFLFEQRGGSTTPEPSSQAAPVISSAPITAPPIPKRWRLFNDVLLELPAGRVTVGRNDDNRIVIGDVSISGHHALLEVLPDALFVTDLGSTNGTLLNGKKLLEGTPTSVSEGDQLTFGALQYRVMS